MLEFGVALLFAAVYTVALMKLRPVLYRDLIIGTVSFGVVVGINILTAFFSAAATFLLCIVMAMLLALPLTAILAIVVVAGGITWVSVVDYRKRFPKKGGHV